MGLRKGHPYKLTLYLLFYGRGLETVMQADYINFVFKFSLPWWQGLVLGKLHCAVTFADPRTAPRLFGQERGHLLYKNRVVANFLLQFLNFRYHGNKGMAEPNVTGIVEFADPENHTIEPKIKTLFYMQPKLSK